MRVLVDGIVSLQECGNLIVVKTVAGMAMAVAAAIDAMHNKDIVGCIAGDDTVFCAVSDVDKGPAIVSYIQSLLSRGI